VQRDVHAGRRASRAVRSRRPRHAQRAVAPARSTHRGEWRAPLCACLCAGPRLGVRVARPGWFAPPHATPRPSAVRCCTLVRVGGWVGAAACRVLADRKGFQRECVAPTWTHSAPHAGAGVERGRRTAALLAPHGRCNGRDAAARSSRNRERRVACHQRSAASPRGTRTAPPPP
jgi:hypothetical protein